MPTTAAHDVSYQSGSNLTVVDQSGFTLTLDVPGREIRYSDGRVVLLSAEQAAEYATDFQGTIVYDQLANELQNLTAGPVLCGGEIACDEPMGVGVGPICDLAGNCDEPIREAQTSAPIFKLLSSSEPQLSHDGVFGLRIRKFESPQAPKPQKSGRGGTGTATILDFYFLPDCQSLKYSVLASMAAYRNERASIISKWKDIAMDAFALEGGRVLLRLSAPIGAGFAASLSADLVNKKIASTQMDIARVVYTSQGCGTISWAGSSQSGGSISGLALVCHVEMWAISFDGGNTWRGITVDVCEFAQQ